MTGSTNLTDEKINNINDSEQITTFTNYKGSGVTYFYGRLIRVGKLVSLVGTWTGSLSGEAAILNLPAEYRPSSRFGGSHIFRASAISFGTCAITPDGKVFDGTTSTTKTEGMITLIYYLG